MNTRKEMQAMTISVIPIVESNRSTITKTREVNLKANIIATIIAITINVLRLTSGTAKATGKALIDLQPQVSLEISKSTGSSRYEVTATKNISIKIATGEVGAVVDLEAF